MWPLVLGILRNLVTSSWDEKQLHSLNIFAGIFALTVVRAVCYERNCLKDTLYIQAYLLRP